MSDQPETENYPSGDMPAVGDVLSGRYELTGFLAEGGMGVIMTARQLSMERDVAVKLVRPEALRDENARQRFEREVHLAKELAHPHIVQLIDFGREGDVAWVAMELLQGETLGDLITREAPLELGRSLDIIEQILDALTVAHRAGVVHRDIKPPNIFVTPGGRQKDFVKVLDFGIARPVESSGLYQTTTGFVSGTLPYMAPEVLAQNDLSPSADVYAVSLVFLEMLYGQRIYDGDNPTRMALQHMRRETPIPEMLLQSALGPVILKATAKRRENRYPDADAFLAAILDARRTVDPRNVLSTEAVNAAFDSVARDVVDDLLPTSDARQSETGTPLIEETAQHTEETVSPRLTVALLVLVVIVLCAGLGFWLMREPAPTESPTVVDTTPPPAVEPEPPHGADIFVDSKPTGAEVWIDGERRYTTPVELRLTERAYWEFRKEGFEPTIMKLGPDTPRVIAHLGQKAIEEPEVEPAATAQPKLTKLAKPKPLKTKPKLKPVKKKDAKEAKRAPQLVD